MKPISPFGLPIGISIAFWSSVGLIRFLWESAGKILSKKKTRNKFKSSDIAVIIPAHNEELGIRKSIQALKESVDAKQIYVISDGSSDKTYRRARMEGCHVSYLTPGRGKAKALVYALKQYKLFQRYKLIFIVDADTRIDKTCIPKALPMFNDLDIGVVFASSKIAWKQHLIPKLNLYFVAYRERLNQMLRYLLIYGQTWKYTNVNYVIPGFAALYRSRVLRKLEIDTPGLLIEDFNLAFQFHHKKIGKIGYSPGLIAWDQYPDNLRDYCSQIRRWNIGFFQTIRKNGIWPSFFWVALWVFSLEVVLNSIFVIILPLLLFYFLAHFLSGFIPILANFSIFYQKFGPFSYLNLRDIFIGTFLIDYLVTLVVGFLSKKPQFIIYGLFFFPMHYIVSLVLLSSIIPGFFGKSSGRWVPPTRIKEQMG